MRDLMLAMELLRNFAGRAGLSSHAVLKLTLTFGDREQHWLFYELMKREFQGVPAMIADISISFDNDQDIDKRKRLSEITRAPTE